MVVLIYLGMWLNWLATKYWCELHINTTLKITFSDRFHIFFPSLFVCLNLKCISSYTKKHLTLA